jgi:carbamoyl-phosphate synthase small subunit
VLQYGDHRLPGDPDRPSYAGQIITFTFPHIGNVGANREDTETSNLAMRSACAAACCALTSPIPPTIAPAEHLDGWLKARGIIAITGIDTRALTARIREKGMPNGVVAHEPSAKFDIEKLKAEAKAWPGLDGMDLVPDVTSGQSYTWDESRWVWGKGYARQENRICTW